jgi:hypothetical protein
MGQDSNQVTPRGMAALSLLLLCVAATACGGAQSPKVAPWASTSVDFGQGQLHIGIRFRWVAEAEPAGAVIRTPEGGEAHLRVFACGKSVKEVQKLLQGHLRSRLLSSQIYTSSTGFHWRWRLGDALTGKVITTAVVLHGPLLLSVSSSTLTEEDLSGIVSRVRLDLPVPTIPSCLPLCETPCKPQNSEDGG